MAAAHRDRPRAHGAVDLELIGDDVVENKILSSRLAMAVQEKAVWDLNDLKLRITHLEGGEELATEDVLRPEALAQLLVEQWSACELARETLGGREGRDRSSWSCRARSRATSRPTIPVDSGVLPAHRPARAREASRRRTGAAAARRRGGPARAAAATGGGTGRGGGGRIGPRQVAAAVAVAVAVAAAATAVVPVAGFAGAAAARAPAAARRDRPAAPARGDAAGCRQLPAAAAVAVVVVAAASRRRRATAPRPQRQKPTAASGGAGAVQLLRPGRGRPTEPRAPTPLARARAKASGRHRPAAPLLSERVAGFDPQGGAAVPPSASLVAGGDAACHRRCRRRCRPASNEAMTAGDIVIFDDAGGRTRSRGDLRSRTQELKKKASTSSEKATIEIVALMFQSILAEERIPPAVRVWFARLQMPVLRVALAEPEFFGSLEHPARQLIDRMGSCVLGFDAAAITGSALETEIKRVVQVIEQYPETGRRVFQLVYDEFQRFLSRYLTEKGPTQKLVSVAQQVEQKETMAIQYTIELRKMLSDVPVREEIREFLFKVWAEVLAVAAVKNGPQHEETLALKKSASDLVWAASAKPNRHDRAKVIQDLPDLLARLRRGMTLLGLQAGRAGEPHQGDRRHAGRRLPVQDRGHPARAHRGDDQAAGEPGGLRLRRRCGRTAAGPGEHRDDAGHRRLDDRGDRRRRLQAQRRHAGLGERTAAGQLVHAGPQRQLRAGAVRLAQRAPAAAPVRLRPTGAAS